MDGQIDTKLEPTRKTAIKIKGPLTGDHISTQFFEV